MRLAPALLAIVTCVLTGMPTASASQVEQPVRSNRHQADRLVVTFRSGAPASSREAAHRAAGARSTRRTDEGRPGAAVTDVVTLAIGSDLGRVSAEYRSRADVVSAEPSWTYRISESPNDPAFDAQWGLHNVGQNVAQTGVFGIADVDIDAPEGWASAYGPGRYPSSGGSVVGVIDTGIDAAHPDLAGKVVACASAITGTGVVVQGVCSDDNGHGTHVAGTVAALAGNAVGVAGVAPDAVLAIFKAMDATGKGADVDIAAGIRWMRAKRVDVINMSFGDPQISSALGRELAAAVADGIVLVAAAGNDGDATTNFPASHRDVISVGAIDAWGMRASFSNCNSDVEVAAPGAAIVSTVPGGYARFDGTSMAAPHVSGVAAVLRSAGGLSATAARTAIASRTSGSGGCNGVGVVNLAAALGVRQPAPAQPAPTQPAPAPSPAPAPASSSPSPAPAAPRAAAPSPTAADRTGLFVALTPTRIVDSRIGLGTGSAPLSARTSRDIVVAGRGGVPAAGVSAVVVNLTVTGPTSQTYLTAYPAGLSRPVASAINVAAGRAAAALVTVGLNGGALSVYNHGGQVDVVLDVVGYYHGGADAGGVGFATTEPTRLLDTRAGGGAITGGSVKVLQVAGRSGVPPAGVSAAVVNITVTTPSRASFLTAYPADTARPPTSSVNVAAGETRANLAVVSLDPSGRMALYNSAGSSHVVVDVLGWYGAGATGRFVSMSPRRTLDTRDAGTPVPSGTSVPVDLGLPAEAFAVVATVTATTPTSPGFLTAHPSGRAPGTSTVNFPAAATVANLAVVPLGDDGRIAVRNGPGRTHALVDVVGYFLAT
ncbi:MAG TPA: S8 family peptidase [Mycobacteriales bacterium]|nr:S8 family peptidase [Mycobacteriales bacterium]